MGKKISWEDAEKLGSLNEANENIILPPNKYGYRVNINHPEVKPHYERYKRSIGAIILSDEERRVFEMHIFEALKKRRNDLSTK